MDSRNLRALGDARNVAAAAICLSTSDIDTSPGPASAGTAATSDDNIITAAGNSTGSRDAIQSQASDGNAARRGTLQVTAVVVLLDEDTILGDRLECNVAVSDTLDLASLPNRGLDADT